MTSEELYQLLTNFQEESLLKLGMEKEDGFWTHPNSIARFEVSGNNLIVYRGGIAIGRLCASINEPGSLYNTLIETDVIEPATHLNYLREKGLKL
ncbi:MAG: hypothetical protein JJU37_15800 [Balneolaceae bacterium]|nr:hypothetical protein [Balneolaceae bacterium]